LLFPVPPYRYLRGRAGALQNEDREGSGGDTFAADSRSYL